MTFLGLVEGDIRYWFGNDLFWFYNISMCYDMCWWLVGTICKCKKVTHAGKCREYWWWGPTQCIETHWALSAKKVTHAGDGAPCKKCRECRHREWWRLTQETTQGNTENVSTWLWNKGTWEWWGSTHRYMVGRTEPLV